MSAIEQRRIEAARDSVKERIERANEAASAPQSRSAEIVPFPSNRRHGFIDRELRSVRDYTLDSAYRYLDSVVSKNRSRLERIGVASALVEADTAALKAAFGLTLPASL